jgi:hypothetical protein
MGYSFKGYYDKKKRPFMRPMVLTLGMTYEIGQSLGKKKRVKLIKTTKLGYNLLNEETNTCLIQKGHLYPDRKCKWVGESAVFWLPTYYTLIDENSVTVSNFSWGNYFNNWVINEE